ncbi:MAG: helix-turn-helix transcriptional regulator [Syntrophales bacterium]|nr:helix-turn-helix transcriptional regulator [Syntrophales bacterium]
MNRNIRAEMVRHGLTIEKMAKVMKASTVTVSKKLNGRRPWTLAEAKMMVDFFNSMGGDHTIESLFYGNVPEAVGSE